MVHILFNTGGATRRRNAAGPATRQGGASQGPSGAARPPRTAAR